MDLLTQEKTKKETQLEEARQNMERVTQSYKGLLKYQGGMGGGGG